MILLSELGVLSILITYLAKEGLILGNIPENEVIKRKIASFET